MFLLRSACSWESSSTVFRELKIEKERNAEGSWLKRVIPLASYTGMYSTFTRGVRISTTVHGHLSRLLPISDFWGGAVRYVLEKYHTILVVRRFEKKKWWMGEVEIKIVMVFSLLRFICIFEEYILVAVH